MQDVRRSRAGTEGRAQAPGPAPSRGETYRRLGSLKRGALAATLLAFGALAGLASRHATGVTAHPPTRAAAAPTRPVTTGFFAQDGANAHSFGDPAPPPPPPPPVVASSAS